MSKSKSFTLFLDGREHLEIRGVTEIEKYSDTQITVFTSRGRLTIRGIDLIIETFNDGDVVVAGDMNVFLFGADDSEKKGDNVISKIFK